MVVGGNPNMMYCFKHGNLTVECESEKEGEGRLTRKFLIDNTKDTLFGCENTIRRD